MEPVEPPAELSTRDILMTVGVAVVAGLFSVPVTVRVGYDWWQQGFTPLVVNQLVYMTIWNLWFLGLPLFKVGLVWLQGAYEHSVPSAVLCRVYCRYQLLALVPLAFALLGAAVGMLPYLFFLPW